MSRRGLLLLAGPLVCFAFVAFSLYSGRRQLALIPRPTFLPGATTTVPTTTTPPENGILSKTDITAYVDAIMHPKATALPRMACPSSLNVARYEYLQHPPPSALPHVSYFFALNLRESLPLLPRLLGSVVETIRFLGPAQCSVSIIGASSSADGTSEVLAALGPEIRGLETAYHLSISPIDSTRGDRIANLAVLRNAALQPLVSDPLRHTANTTVLFLNDVAICPEDLLELLHQRLAQSATMTCALDWTFVGADPTFYDVWIARALESGDTFFAIPPSGSWDAAWDLLPHDPAARARLAARAPFQVFSCWNGAAIFSAQPLVEAGVAFRGPREREGECMQGEPQLFCKDLWFRGYGRIAVVPSVNVEYSDDRGRQIKELKGYTSQWAGRGPEADQKIQWQREPPEKVKCMPTHDNQFWQAWNETLS